MKKTTAVDALYSHYQRADRNPPSWADGLVASTLGKVDDARAINLLRRLRSLRLPVAPLDAYQADEIDLLIVAAGKDFPLLPLSIAGAWANCGNPIRETFLVVPERDFKAAERIAETFPEGGLISIRCEDDFVSEDIRHSLRTTFGARYGWILQQLLCVVFVAQSSAHGVLVLDADTILLTKRTFLAEGKQLLLPSLELHPPYYTFLRQLDSRFLEPEYSFVSHHMLQQPRLMREYLLRLGCQDPEKLIGKVIANADLDQVSSLSIDYELYAQSLLLDENNPVVLAKWSNASAPPSLIKDSPNLSSLSARFSKYCSISLHSYA